MDFLHALPLKVMMPMAHTLVHGQISLNLVAIGGQAIAYLPLLLVCRLLMAVTLIAHSSVFHVR